VLLCGVSLFGQTTQGLISGRVRNSVNGQPLGGARIEYSALSGVLSGSSQSDEEGYYYLPLLSPGLYRVRVEAQGYQAQEVQELELPVAARLELEFRIRPLSDVWEGGQYKSVFLPGYKTIVTFFGPDVDSSRSGSFEAQKGRVGALESTVSNVIDGPSLQYLPLAGRDVYTMLVTQPGVTSDAGTARGLGLSINGQRPSASNYLLDGLENNNYLVTGPLTRVAPEAIQEYRVSTNNFSAEYGRTSGFLANAITRSGTNGFHGLGYFYLRNDVLNANSFLDNLRGAERVPYKESQPGFVVGGPVLRNRLYFSSAFERFRSRSFQDVVRFTVPAIGFQQSFSLPSRRSFQLLERYAPPPVRGNGIVGNIDIRPPVSLDRSIAIERLDYTTPSGRDRLMGRVMIARLTRPDFIWTPYPDFVSALHQDTNSVAVTWTRTLRASLTNEARFGFSNDDLNWDRPHPEVPTFAVGSGFGSEASLPGSPAFYEYRNRNRSVEVLDNIIYSRGRHLLVAGAGMLQRNSDGYLTSGRDGQYRFVTIAQFALDRPFSLRAGVERTGLPQVRQPGFDRSFRYRQYFGFVQDTFKVTSRLTTNFGLRYELFGSPFNTGSVKDALVELGAGDTLARQLTGARLRRPASGEQELFGTDKKNFAVRAGASYDLTGSARTLLRGAYGIFYDRPFDNLWQNMRNNDFILPTININREYNYLQPIGAALPVLAAGRALEANFPGLTLVDAGLKNGYIHSYFAGLQHRISQSLSAELNALGSYGRRLITTDIVNRDFTLATGRYNPALPDIFYRANQGFSNYNAMTALVRYRASRGSLQAMYTWSHVIDNQSEPLLGDFFNLNFTTVRDSSDRGGRAAFPLQFNPLSDRGNSDFDQRHNMVILSYWNLPAPFQNSKAGVLFRNWTVSQLAAFRSGSPYTLVGTSNAENGTGLIFNNRPNLINPAAAVLAQPKPIAGGMQLLNPLAFENAGVGVLGNVGRNSFTGPGLYNLDLSVGRTFGLRWLGESGRINFRADAYNALNHANLNNPQPLLTDDTFGQALYGRQGKQSGFPAVSPLNETARQFQLSVRVEF
jgi:hypothetical protein